MALCTRTYTLSTRWPFSVALLRVRDIHAGGVAIFYGPTFVLFVRQRKQEELPDPFSGDIVFEEFRVWSEDKFDKDLQTIEVGIEGARTAATPCMKIIA
jgi:hypothetical protein